jgi:hypothetical protein
MKKVFMALLLTGSSLLAKAQYAQIEIVNTSSEVLGGKLYGNPASPIPVCELGPQTAFLPFSTYALFTASTTTYITPSTPATTLFSNVIFQLTYKPSAPLTDVSMRYSICTLPSSGTITFPAAGISVNYFTTPVSASKLRITFY